ncbi:MAG TPA: HAD family hydrolase [Bryobacteraceae bacterium]|nr:HAD family hydrolase [Bryobacteraceae bacterium]
MSEARPAVFLDRDGVLIEDHPDYVRTLDQVHIVPGAGRALARLVRAAWPVVVVTNQAAVGHGYISEELLSAIHGRMAELLQAEDPDARPDRIYHCPYHAKAKLDAYRQDSPFRKPAPGMLVQAARELNLDLARSYMVGDRESDIGAAIAAGCVPLLVLTGFATRDISQWTVQPAHILEDLTAAVDLILGDAQ